jgi:ribosomal-protein-alanine N-acetyltransferase
LSNINFEPFPVLETNEYTLRELKTEDADEIYIIRSDEQILKYLDITKATSLDDAKEFIEKINNGIKENKWSYWGITKKGNPKIIGTICLWNTAIKPRKADIGFVLLPEYQGQGIMQKIIPLVINYGFTKMGLERIEGEVSPHNIKSIKLMEKHGFKFYSKLDETDIYVLENTNK